MKKHTLTHRALASAAVASMTLAGLAFTAGASNADEPVAPSFSITVPETLRAGGEWTTYTGHLDAGSGAENIFVETEILGADATNLDLEWKNGETWEPMVAEAITGGVVVGFADGDADEDGITGFTAPAGYTADTEFRVRAQSDAAGSELTWTSTLLHGVDATKDGEELSHSSGTIDVQVAPSFSLDVPETLTAGADWSEYEGHLDGGWGDPNLFVETEISGVDAGSLDLQWKNGETWTDMIQTETEDGIVTGFGDGDADQDGVTGFPVPAHYTATTEFRVRAHGDAIGSELDWTSTLLHGVNATLEGDEVDSSTGTITVRTETATTLTAASAAANRVTLTATVAPASAGSVSFYEGETKVGTATVTTGNAVLALTGVKAGTHSYRAVFASGEAVRLGSESGSASVTVKDPVVVAPPVVKPPVVLTPAQQKVAKAKTALTSATTKVNSIKAQIKDAKKSTLSKKAKAKKIKALNAKLAKAKKAVKAKKTALTKAQKALKK